MTPNEATMGGAVRRVDVWTWVGLGMMAHAGLLAALKVARDTPGEMLWASHAGLLLGAVGVLMRSRFIVATSLLLVAGLHAVWCFDAVIGSVSGTFPLGFTSWLAREDALTLGATMHHAYLVPVLAWWLRAHPRPGARWAWLGEACAASVVFAVLSVVSRAALPASLNVDFAHAVRPESDSAFFIGHNAMPAWLFLTTNALFYTLVFVAPVALALHAVSQRASRDPGCAVRHAERQNAPARTAARPAFSLIELIAVIVVLAVLAGVAVPKYIDYSSRAKDAADTASIAALNTALNNAYVDHRVNNTASGWITSVANVASCLDNGTLPSGITIDSTGTRLRDQRGNEYTLTAETATTPARLVKYTSGSGS